jgi:hypothetical protein
MIPNLKIIKMLDKFVNQVIVKNIFFEYTYKSEKQYYLVKGYHNNTLICHRIHDNNHIEKEYSYISYKDVCYIENKIFQQFKTKIRKDY